LINLALPPRLLKADTVGYVLLLFLINLFLPIPARQIISQSNGPIFAKFSGLVKLWLYDQPETSFFRSLKGRCHGNQLLLVVHECLWARRLVAQPGGLTFGFVQVLLRL